MATYLAPGVFIEELATGPRPIEAVNTTMAGFVGLAPLAGARVNEAVRIGGYDAVLKSSDPLFSDIFVGDARVTTPLAQAVHGFFVNGGSACYVVNLGAADAAIGGGGRGLDQLELIEEIAMIAAPGRTDPDSHARLLASAERLGDRVAILDGPRRVDDVEQLTRVAMPPLPAEEGAPPATDAAPAARPGLRPPISERGFGALYFPWLLVRDPIEDRPLAAPPSGAVAGVCARMDRERGVHKAPAGLQTRLRDALAVTQTISRTDQETLNPAGVNVIRSFATEGAAFVWGARTLAASASEWRYLNVRRLFIMIERSILRSTRWVVFEPNDRPLWKLIVRDVEAFLTLVWQSGALMGTKPEQAFFVKCDETTNTTEAINAGMVVTLIGLAPVKPAEFVVFRIGQSATGGVFETA